LAAETIETCRDFLHGWAQAARAAHDVPMPPAMLPALTAATVAELQRAGIITTRQRPGRAADRPQRMAGHDGSSD